MEYIHFRVEQLEFYGNRLTKEGLRPTLDKVKAVKDSRCPETKEAVSRFLGMTLDTYPISSHGSHHLQHQSDNSLRKRSGSTGWGMQEQTVFEKLKDSITRDNTMIYFNPTKPIVVRAEASYLDGLSAGLLQDIGKELQPVHFISRAMTDTEKKI